MSHLLLQKAFRFVRRRNLSLNLEDYEYDFILGCWISKIDHRPFTKSTDFPSLGKKKFDVETGEDHKGQ